MNQEVDCLNALSWPLLARETQLDPVLANLFRAIRDSCFTTHTGIDPFLRYKDELSITRDVILFRNRVVVPQKLQAMVLEVLHSAHQGVAAMGSRARSAVFWPGITNDIASKRKECSECNRNAPSQPHLPCDPSPPPTKPFQQIFADFFEFAGRNHLIVGDRFSGWADIYPTPNGSGYSGAKGLIRCLRSFFATYGVPEEISSDGGPEFASSGYKYFLNRWGVRQRVSSAYFPRSNGRAEVAVKSAKRLLMSPNRCPNGSMDNDRFMCAIMQLRNTPDPESGVSPAQILYGRPLNDAFAFVSELHSNSPEINPWKEPWESKGSSLIKSYNDSANVLRNNSRYIPPLKVGEWCLVQNQKGNRPLKWDRSGVVVEVLPHDQYAVRIHGTDRITNRNRKFLRSIDRSVTTAPRPAITPLYLGEETDHEASEPFSPRPNSVRGSNLQSRPPVSRVHNQPPSLPHHDACRSTTAVSPSLDNHCHPQPQEVYPRPSSPCVPQLSEDPHCTFRETVPRAVRNLLPANNPGLKEDTNIPATRLRPR